MHRGVVAILAGGRRAGRAQRRHPPCRRPLGRPRRRRAGAGAHRLRDYVRTYAFLAQIMPFTDADLEELYYYGKYLLTRLPSPILVMR